MKTAGAKSGLHGATAGVRKPLIESAAKVKTLLSAEQYVIEHCCEEKQHGTVRTYPLIVILICFLK